MKATGTTNHIIFRLLARAAGTLAAVLLFSTTAWALQFVDVADQRSHLVTISEKEMTRISVERGKIVRMDYIDGELDVMKDDEAGAWFIIPTVAKHVNVFVTTSSGQTHALILEPKGIPLETVILREARERSQLTPTDPNIEKAGSLELAVKRLISAMARSEEPEEFDVSAVQHEVKLWREAHMVLERRYMGIAMEGEVYRLTNISGQVMRLAEQELYKPGVLAIAMDALELAPGAFTRVYIARTVSHE